MCQENIVHLPTHLNLYPRLETWLSGEHRILLLQKNQVQRSAPTWTACSHLVTSALGDITLIHSHTYYFTETYKLHTNYKVIQMKQ